jgi:hypothetical protein
LSEVANASFERIDRLSRPSLLGEKVMPSNAPPYQRDKVSWNGDGKHRHVRHLRHPSVRGVTIEALPMMVWLFLGRRVSRLWELVVTKVTKVTMFSRFVPI